MSDRTTACLHQSARQGKASYPPRCQLRVGTLERRYALALILRALKPGAPLTALAPKEKGGSRLGKE